jgi:hypothetical protein
MHAPEPLLNDHSFFHETEITTGRMKTLSGIGQNLAN